MMIAGTVLAVSTSSLWAEDVAMGADLYKADRDDNPFGAVATSMVTYTAG